ncbi:unnamed protein product [Calypogeia fissa]
MAVTAVTSWDPSFLSSYIVSSSCAKWNRLSFRSEHHKRLLKLHDNFNSLHTFSSGCLRYISSICGDNHQVFQWQGGRKGTQSKPCRPGTRLEVFSIVTEKIVSGSQFSTNSDQSVRRLILLRHAKSSWSDRSIKAIHDIASASPTSRTRISKIWSNMDKSWASDHERPLSRRGRQAAANIALKLQECAGWEPQLILCSDSTRTRQTLEIMQQQLPEFLEGEVRYFSSFYSIAAMDGQTVQHLQEIICKYSKTDVTTIMCMGHNRGWEEAASLLSGVNVELKTANAALLETRGASWQEAFEKAGLGGWKLIGVVKPDPSIVEGAVQ